MTLMIIKMHSFKRSVSLGRRTASNYSSRLGRISFVSRGLCSIIVIGSVLSFLMAIGAGYIYVLPNLTDTFHGYHLNSEFNGSVLGCDVFNGNWVLDDSYPLYNASECPFSEQGFNCLGNGRVDRDYLKWRWKPQNCDIPRLNVLAVLDALRGKRIVFVGDSMSRTQWESLICLLMIGVEDKQTVYEVNGNKITKHIRYLGVRFSTFNLTIEFFRSVFLVQYNWTPKHGPRRVRSTLKLDKLDDISYQWTSADILIFNSGQWWVPGKLFGAGCYFQVGNSVKLGMSIASAFKAAMQTWASWVDAMIDPKKTYVFFRTFEPSHWSNLSLRLCNVTPQPLSETKGMEQSSFSDTILEIVQNMTIPVTILRITYMSAFRSDAHVGNWSDNLSVPDCSHWCLPGVPDVWNEIVFTYLLSAYKVPSASLQEN